MAIVGAGLGGIATAVKLQNAGFPRFMVFEQSAGPGGTWWDNTYPGCEVDIHSHLYSYSFRAHDWTRSHAGQPELQRYIEETIDEFGIRDRMRFGARVEEVSWDDEREHWRVRLADGEELQFDMVVSAVGILNHPRFPDWPGLDAFRGPHFHTARWQHEHDLTGRRIAFVGTGSTGAQVVPKLAEIAEHLYVYQRQPGWLLPKREREFTTAERRRYMRWRIVRTFERLRRFREAGRLISAFQIGTPAHERLKREALEYLNNTVRDPEVRRALTPDYPFACKRVVLSSTYLPSFNRPNVTLVPHAVERVTPDGVVSADGQTREVDVLVMGTGFTASSFLADLRVRGIDGRELHEVWGDEPRAVAGSTVPGFPNFFIIYGPNTNGGGSIVYQNERAAEIVVRAAKRLRRTGAGSLDTRPIALRLYVRWIDKAVSTRMDAMSSGLCNNYFRAPSGRDVVSWPYSHLAFNAMTRIVPRLALRTRRAAGLRVREPVPDEATPGVASILIT